MRINGKRIEGPNVEMIFIPRGDGQDIVLKAQAVMDFDPFYKMSPRPVPPKVRGKDGRIIQDVEDPGYKKHCEEFAHLRHYWMIIKSLEATEGLEWDKVHLNDPNTWGLVETELREAGFNEPEIVRIIEGVFTANSLNEARMDEARKRFLAKQGMEPLEGYASLRDEPKSTQSGEPASGSESDPQASPTPGN